MLENIAIIDFEASSLNSGSYPIELGVCLPDTRYAESKLIRPVPKWCSPTRKSGWSYESQQIHGISFEQLEKEGEDAKDVVNWFFEVVGNRTIVSDAPEFDQYWLHTLIKDSGIEKNLPLLERIQFLWVKCAKFDSKLVESAISLAKIKEPPTHRALNDVKHMMKVFEIILDKKDF